MKLHLATACLGLCLAQTAMADSYTITDQLGEGAALVEITRN